MKIQKILNNNVIVTLDGEGREQIAMGLGIAFQKRPGDEIPDEKVEKVFVLRDRTALSRFQELLSSIPMQQMLLSERIINYAKTKLGRKLNDLIYVTLPDHISFAISRYQEGVPIQNPLLWDVKRFYPDEFEVGQKAIQVVREETGIQFREDEAAFIAQHFVNAELTEPVNSVNDLTEIIQCVFGIVKRFYNTEFDEDSLDYYRFVNHLKFFAQRVVQGVHYEERDAELLEVVRFKHPRAAECAERVREVIQKRYAFLLTGEELLYLTVHIARITRRLDEFV